MKQNRWKSKLMWVTLISQACVILVTLGIVDSAMSDKIQTVSVCILSMLASVGIVNDPTNGSGW